MLKYFLLLTIAVIIAVCYTLTYYRRFNVALNDKSKKLYKVSPTIFISFLMVFFLSIGFMTSIYDLIMLEKEKVLAQEYMITNRYLKEGFGNVYAEYVFVEYNLYFAGTYISDDEVIICIRSDSPQELVEYLDDNSANYIKVQYNYSDLLLLKQMLIRSESDIENVYGVGIDESINKVVIYTSNVDYVTEYYSDYIDENILHIRESAEIVEH
jgi:hypothetical protein